MFSKFAHLQQQRLTALAIKRPLHFARPSGTSRGVLTQKPCWYLVVQDENGQRGVGECGPIWGLSPEQPETYEHELARVCELVNDFPLVFEDGSLDALPSIKFGLETALLDLATGGHALPYPSPFTEGADEIRINGLIWMGSQASMLAQIDDKLQAGFKCLKLKIGAIDWETELGILKGIRQQYPPTQLELRVDANGGFKPAEAMTKLEQLAQLHIHSIEQPIMAGQWEAMAALCNQTPLPIALDEELIGINGPQQTEMLNFIKPHYLILKPSLLGGLCACENWITLAEQRNIGWWNTSMLESNVGLNAIAQWTYTLANPLPQGLGTGQLYTNNLPSPLYLNGEYLRYNPATEANLEEILS